MIKPKGRTSKSEASSWRASVNISSATKSDGQSGLDLAAYVPFFTTGPIKVEQHLVKLIVNGYQSLGIYKGIAIA